MAGRRLGTRSAWSVGILLAAVLVPLGSPSASPAAGAAQDDPTTTVAAGTTTTTVAPTTTTSTTVATSPVPTEGNPLGGGTTTTAAGPPATTTPGISIGTLAPIPTATTTPGHPPTTGVPTVPTGAGAGGGGALPSTAAPAIAGIDADMARLAELARYRALQAVERAQLAGIVTDRRNVDADLDAVTGAVATQYRAHQAVGSVESVLQGVAVAAYVGGAYPAPDDPASGPNGTVTTQQGLQGLDAQEANVLVGLVITRVEGSLDATLDVAAVADRATAAARARVVAAGRVVSSALRAVRATAATITSLAGVLRSGRTPAGSGGDDQAPTIRGPVVLTSAEIAGWFATTHERPRPSVKVPALADDFVGVGQQIGVRGDVAFAQSVVETGYFSFPAHGQLTAADHNYAGIGACDSCAHGWSFPSPLVGVTAQLQLLDAYATPGAISTPLIGAVGVGGCCPTWTDLARHWATSPTYGIEILTVYRRMLDWAVTRRVAAAGL